MPFLFGRVKGCELKKLFVAIIVIFIVKFLIIKHCGLKGPDHVEHLVTSVSFKRLVALLLALFSVA